MHLNNKTILITGATGGLGFALTKHCFASGANIIMHGRDKSKLQQVATEISQHPDAPIYLYNADLSDTTRLKDSFQELINESGAIDMAFFCHATNAAGLHEDIPSHKALELLNCNFSSISIMSSLLLKSMKTHGKSSLVYILSGTSVFPLPTYSIYSASKAALYSLAKSIRMENQHNGINVSLVFPGKLDTSFDQKAFVPDGTTTPSGTLLAASDPDRIAKKIVAGAVAQQGMIVFSRLPFLIALVNLIFPSLTEKLISRKIMNRE